MVPYSDLSIIHNWRISVSERGGGGLSASVLRREQYRRLSYSRFSHVRLFHGRLLYCALEGLLSGLIVRLYSDRMSSLTELSI